MLMCHSVFFFLIKCCCFVQGLVRAVGVSNYGPKQLLKIHDYLKSRGVPLCSAQVLHGAFCNVNSCMLSFLKQI